MGRGSSPLLRRPPPRLLAGFAAAAAGAALPAALTGISALDRWWSAALVGAAALVGSWAPRVVVLVALAAVAVSTSDWLSLLAAAVAVGAALIGTAAPALAGPPAGALAAGGAALAVLHSSSSPLLPRSLAGVAALAAIASAGVLCMPAAARRRTVWGSAGAALLMAGVAGSATWGAFTARTSVERGVTALEVGLRAGRAGDLGEARRRFDAAVAAFTDARRRLRTWAGPAAALPVAAQNLRAVQDVLDSVLATTEDAAAAAHQLDAASLTFRDGAMDLDRVAALGPPLSLLADDLAALRATIARSSSAPLVPAVRARLEDLDRRSAGAEREMRRAARAAVAVPRLLGAERPQRYLVLLTSPAEARGRFGFPASYLLLQADQGRVELVEVDRITALDPPSQGFDQSMFDHAASGLVAYVPFGTTRDWRSVTIPSDFGVVAEVARKLWQQLGREDLDGVLRLGPEALAALVGLTGPVESEELREPLTSDNLVEYLNLGQYVRPAADDEPAGAASRRDVLATLAKTVFERLAGGELPPPGTLLDRFGPVAAVDGLQAHVFDPANAQFLHDLGIDGCHPCPAAGDAVVVTHVNTLGNKIDTFLHRELNYLLDLAPASGAATGAIEVRLRNEAPAGGLPSYLIGNSLPPGAPEPPPGTNQMALLFDTTLVPGAVTIDDEPVLATTARAGGRWVTTVDVAIPPGGTTTVRLELSGTRDSNAPYRLVLGPSGLAHPEMVTVDVRRDGEPTVRYAGATRGPLVLPEAADRDGEPHQDHD